MLEDNCTKAFNCPNWELERRRREIDRLDALLSEQYVKRRQKNTQVHLEIDHLNFKLRVMQQYRHFYEQYLQSCQEKHAQLLTRLRNSTSQIQSNKLIIEELKVERTELIKIRHKLSERLDKFRVVRTFLDEVQNASGAEFSSNAAIVDRFNYLISTRAYLIEKIEKSNQHIQELKLDMGNTTQVDDDVLILQERLTKIRKENEDLRAQFHAIENQLAERKQQLVTVFAYPWKIEAGIVNLFSHCCELINYHPKADGIKEKVAFIQSTFKQLLKLRDEAYRLTRATSNMATIGS